MLVALFFGLRARGATGANQVAWHSDRAGLQFGRFGMAYCRHAFVAAPDPAPQPAAALSFELAVRAAALKRDRFQILLMLHGGQDGDQLVIGQWRSALIVMQGNDYSGRGKRKRLGVAEALPAGVERLITIVSEADGTRIFIDGRPAAHSKSLTLQIPNQRAPVTLLVGNSVYARHYWQGDLFGLAVYTQALPPEVVADHFDRWQKERDLSSAVTASPEMLYLFNDAPGQKALNRMGDDRYLSIPAHVQLLKKDILNPPWDNLHGKAAWRDIVINFLGFVPLGFFLSALWFDLGGGAARRNYFWCVGLGFMLSLGIELAQAWIPSRSSHMLDLLLNTLGAATGVLLHRWQRSQASRKGWRSI